MTITTEEVEALAAWADRTAKQQGPACLVADHTLSSIATTLRALDAERRELRTLLNVSQAEAFGLAAAVCPTFYGDEWGHARCKAQDDLRAQLAGARNEGIVAAANKARDVFRDCLNGAQIRSAIRSLMTPEAK